MLIISADNNKLNILENSINKYIEIEKIGPPKSFLENDIEIDYNNKRLYINQTVYTNKLLEKFNINLSNYKPSLIPGVSGLKLNKNINNSPKEEIRKY